MGVWPPKIGVGKYPPNHPFVHRVGTMKFSPSILRVNPPIFGSTPKYNAAGAAIILAVLYGWKSQGKGRKPAAVWKTHGSDTRLYLAGANGRERFGAGGT